jgi:CpeT/CpcT family (DUF1001)
MARSKWLWAGLLALAACASQPKRDEVFVAELAAMLPGSYDNLAQARAAAGHPGLKLVVAPVQAALLGEHVFYVQETAADDALRVLAQHMYIVDGVPGQELAVVRQADLVEPLRWRNGHENRSLFRGMLAEDLRPRAGCNLLFRREAEGFSAGTTGNCRASAAGTGEALRVEQRITLDGDGIALFEQQRDAAGQLVKGGGSDPWYRFARRADAPW